MEAFGYNLGYINGKTNEVLNNCFSRFIPATPEKNKQFELPLLKTSGCSLVQIFSQSFFSSFSPSALLEPTFFCNISTAVRQQFSVSVNFVLVSFGTTTRDVTESLGEESGVTIFTFSPGVVFVFAGDNSLNMAFNKTAAHE